jgi:uncharacterized protein YndB with AHSA1/START domain
MSSDTGARKTRTIETTIEIPAPVEAVWRALTEAEEIQRWFAPEAHVAPGTGGTIRWKWQEIAWESRIEAWEPGRHLLAVYDNAAKEGGPQGPATLAMDFSLEARGGRTQLRLVHAGFGYGAGWDEEYDGVRRGWHYELRSLRHYLLHHAGRQRRLAWARVPVAGPGADTWSRLAGPAGLLPLGPPERLVEGSRYSLSAATGDSFTGRVLLYAPQQEFSATVENMGDSLLRVAVENCGSGPEAWIWLASWRLPEAEVSEFGARWQKRLAEHFSASATAFARPR